MKSVIETFKPVKGYKGLYEVSNQGNVRALNYNHTRTCKELKNVKQPNGYECICLYRDGKRKWFRVHRLVWETFVGPIPEGMEIDHVNTVRDDNRLANLRCVTPKENRNNPITLVRKREAQREEGKRRSQDPKWREAVREATRKACNKHVLQLDMVTGEVIREWECARDVERELGIDFCSISACCHGRYKSAGGFKWKFA